MIIREGFVSNSSTTSFTCDACGDVIAYHDSCSYDDLGIVRFSCGHEICECIKIDLNDESNQLKWVEGVKEEIQKEIENVGNCKYLNSLQRQERINELKGVLENNIDDIGFWEFTDDVDSLQLEFDHPANLCPVCTLQNLNEHYILNYFLAKHKTNLAKLLKEIQGEFSSFDNLKEWISEQNDNT